MGKFPRKIIIHRYENTVLFFRKFFQHSGYFDLPCSDYENCFRKSIRFEKSSFKLTVNILITAPIQRQFEVQIYYSVIIPYCQ